MGTIEMRQKLHDYIEAAEDRKIEAIYTMVEDEIEEAYNHWEDEEFVEELVKEEEAYLSGVAKTYSFEEVNTLVDETIKKAGKNNSAQR